MTQWKSKMVISWLSSNLYETHIQYNEHYIRKNIFILAVQPENFSAFWSFWTPLIVQKGKLMCFSCLDDILETLFDPLGLSSTLYVFQV